MSFREKCNIKIENGKAAAIIVATIIICTIGIAIACAIGMNKVTYASVEAENEEVTSNLQGNINIIDILKKNTSRDYHEEYFIEEKDLEYLTTYQDNPDLPKGMVQVLQEGRDGTQKVTTKKTYENGELMGEEVVGSQIIKAAINKVVQVGTSKYSSK